MKKASFLPFSIARKRSKKEMLKGHVGRHHKTKCRISIMNFYETVLLVIGCILAIGLIGLSIFVRYAEFSREKRYLNCELRRCSGKERKYYKARKRRLLLSFFFPFIKY